VKDKISDIKIHNHSLERQNLILETELVYLTQEMKEKKEANQILKEKMELELKQDSLTIEINKDKDKNIRIISQHEIDEI